MRRSSVWVAGFLVALLVTNTAEALFHIMRIDEVMAQAGGDPRIQFIEFEMEAASQNFVGGHTLIFFDAEGREIGDFVIPENVPNGALGDSILFGTEAFQEVSSVAPDFIIPAGLLDPFGGRVCFEDIDCVAYGNFAGDNTGYGAPAPGFPVLGVLGLERTRTERPRDNSTDFSLEAPTPRNNAREEGEVNVTDPPCFLEDDFTDLANWDKPADGMGLDLTNCGLPAQADIGTIEVEDGKLLFIPSLTDQIDIGNPIVFASMANETAIDILEESPESYRVRFDMLAQLGIVQGAAFVGQHNSFDEAQGFFDPIDSAGMGMNFTFGCHQQDAPEPCPDSESDHVHLDVRGPCIQGTDDLVTRAEPEGAFDDALFTDIEFLEPETRYTLIMDVDGDDVNGPLTLQVKVFPAGEPEPPAYTVRWEASLGIQASPESTVDHLLLIAALRADSVAQGPALEVSDLKVCAIPVNQKRVRFLECVREPDGSISVSWDSPFDADFSSPITIRIDGEQIETIGGDETRYVIEEPPEGDFEVSVVNYSGVPVSCSICANDPPEPVIDGPSQVEFEGESVVIALDSSGSSDPDGTTDLFRFWEVLEAPAGSAAFFDDPVAVSPNLTVDQEGTYRVLLSLTDNGCPGDPLPLTGEVEHEIAVAEPQDVPAFVRGDVDSSDGLNITDAIVFLGWQFLGDPPPSCLDAADVDDSGSHNITDAIVILQFLFLGEEPPPDPSPPQGRNIEARDCGPDPTDDDPFDCAQGGVLCQ